jgi:hypothetical protein
MRFPIKVTFKSSVTPIGKEVAKPVKEAPVDSFEVKLGCLSDKEEAIYKSGKIRKKRFYHLKPLTINRPPWGITEEKISCNTCNRSIYVTVYSRMASRLRRLSALGFSLLPVTISVIAILLLNIVKHNHPADSKVAADMLGKITGFSIIIFLALVWMIPVFLPVVFRKEHKLALRLLAEKGDRQHRFYETNVESVTQETFFK